MCVCLGVDKDLFFPSYRLVGAAISDTLSHVIGVLVSTIIMYASVPLLFFYYCSSAIVRAILSFISARYLGWHSCDGCKSKSLI